MAVGAKVRAGPVGCLVLLDRDGAGQVIGQQDRSLASVAPGALATVGAAQVGHDDEYSLAIEAIIILD